MSNNRPYQPHYEQKPEGMLPVPLLEELSSDARSGVRREKTRLHLALSPSSLGGGVKQGLESVMMENLNKYYPEVGAILLGWDKLVLRTRRGRIMADSPYIHVDVEGWVFLFNPEVGSKILGKVIKKTAGHIGCLIHETFNVSLFCDKDQFNIIQLEEMVTLRVTSLNYDNRRRPYIHGRLDGHAEPDYDSGIDSTINGQQENDLETQSVSHKNDAEDQSTSSTKSKKGKKRKREAEESVELETSEGGTGKKKKKKKTKSSE